MMMTCIFPIYTCRPAGIDRENTGHHHLLINVKDLDFLKPIPASKNHIHFGGGQTESLVELPPGDYRLQLVLGDMTHTPHTRMRCMSHIAKN